MTLEETRKRILEDDEFVREETEKLRYLYRLKKEIRFALERKEILDTESVAEHIYGMHVLANYFLPFEDPENKLDKLKILETITWHDIEEVETGDTISHAKTQKHLEEAEVALKKVLGDLPISLKERATDLMEEYEAKQTEEAKFIKAIDKLEPLFEVRFDSYKIIMHKNDNTLGKHMDTKYVYVKDFPYILRFFDVLTKDLVSKGFFAPEA